VLIIQSLINKKPSIIDCPRCQLVNTIENKYCSKCSYPVKPEVVTKPYQDTIFEQIRFIVKEQNKDNQEMDNQKNFILNNIYSRNTK
jgi:integrase/recombinase XerD